MCAYGKGVGNLSNSKSRLTFSPSDHLIHNFSPQHLAQPYWYFSTPCSLPDWPSVGFSLCCSVLGPTSSMVHTRGAACGRSWHHLLTPPPALGGRTVLVQLHSPRVVRGKLELMAQDTSANRNLEESLHCPAAHAERPLTSSVLASFPSCVSWSRFRNLGRSAVGASPTMQSELLRPMLPSNRLLLEVAVP